MNALFLLGLVLFVSSSVSAVSLENLCQNAVFTYKNKFEINSVHRVKINKTLDKVGYFVIDEELDFTSFFENATDLESMETLREKYNQFVIGVIYTEETLNNPSQLGILEHYLVRLEEFRKQTSELHEKAERRYSGQFNEILNANTRTVDLINLLIIFRDGKLRPEIISLANFKYLINNMQIEKETQVYAFQNDLLTSTYKRPIEKLERFFFHRKSDKYYDFDSNGVIEFSVVFPFHSTEWKASTACLSGNELPAFYASKTRN